MSTNDVSKSKLMFDLLSKLQFVDLPDFREEMFFSKFCQQFLGHPVD